MLRIHFTLADLVRTRVTIEPIALRNTVYNGRALPNGGGRLAVDHPPAQPPAPNTLLSWSAEVDRTTVDQSSGTPVHDDIRADQLRRIKAFADGGVEGMLTSFHPLLEWHPPVLESDYSIDRDLYLSGRGLLLVPMFLRGTMPVRLADARRQPILLYPVDHDPHGTSPHRDSSVTPRRAADALLGRTRSAVLHGIEEGCTTSELARRCGVAAATASQHASVLRNVGLILTQRHGGSVRHRLTPLGAAVIAGRASPLASPRSVHSGAI